MGPWARESNVVPLPHTSISAQSRKILTDVNSFGHHANTRETHDAGPWAP